MPLQYIIDGYNIINHPQFTRRVKTSQDNRLALIALIIRKKLTGSLKNKVAIVFDGYPDASAQIPEDKSLGVIFSRRVSADEKIKMLVEETANRKNIIVVSDDREIKYTVNSLGAHALGVDEFFAAKEKSGKIRKNEPIKPELNYSQMHKINEELSRIWLKD